MSGGAFEDIVDLICVTIVLVILALVLGACGRPRTPLQVLPSPGLYESVAAQITTIDAVADANLVEIAGGAGGGIVWATQVPKLENNEWGQYTYATRTIEVSEACEASLLPVVITHEIGHALGLAHSSDPKSVMYKQAHYMTSTEAAESLVRELAK